MMAMQRALEAMRCGTPRNLPDAATFDEIEATFRTERIWSDVAVRHSDLQLLQGFDPNESGIISW